MATTFNGIGTPGEASPAAGLFAADHKFYDRKFLEALQPAELYHMWGDMRTIGPNSSNTIVVKKVGEFTEDVAAVTLTEGNVPSELAAVSLVRTEKSVDQYGGYITTSDRLEEEGLDGTKLELTKRMGQHGARTMNKVRRDGLLGGTSERFQNGVATQDLITSALSSANVATDLDFILDDFRNNYVKEFYPMTSGSPNEGTTPIPGGYVVVVPVAAIDTIRGTTGFDEVETYGGQVTLLHKNEFGRYRNFRFIYDTEVKTVTNAAGTPQTIAQCLIFGQGDMDKAYVTVDLAGGNMQMITKPLGSAGSADPLNQIASMGWKAKQATFIVQDSYMYRWEISLGNA